MFFSDSVILKKVMNIADNYICPFPTTDSLINQVIYLIWQAFGSDTKNMTLSGGLEIYGTWLMRIMRVMDLLCEIKTIVKGYRLGIRLRGLKALNSKLLCDSL